MYIDKWRDNIFVGDTDDSMTLIDYFQAKNKKTYAFGKIIKDFQLGKLFGKKPLYESPEIECFYWVEKNTSHADIDIPINLIIDLSALLLQSLVEGHVILEDEDMKFSLSADKKEIRLIIAELEQAVAEPHLYYPDFLQNEFSDMTGSIKEICKELAAYC